ncbi:MAG: ParB/RepB/Spo0J family partition protein [Clostridia bacterium]|jgi:ParB-like partition proteins|nr:ParB/RepB/Spo0J family partition protein [Clostridia bacterium]MBO4792818.1 ParB/RepB/Spo0J family partition protein [Clostridia bacterium]
MPAPKRGLGRNFNSLFEDNIIEEEKKNIRTLRLSDIEPTRGQPRKNFDETALAALAASIASVGLLQPIVVTENTDFPGTYRILAGERRWRASRIAGLTEIPCVVFSGDELAAAQVSLVENIQREDLSPIEEALAFRALMERFGLTQEEVSEKTGRSRPAVANTMRLLELPEDIRSAVSEGLLSAGHARALLPLKDADLMKSLAVRITSEDLSVRQTEKEVKALLKGEKRTRKVPDEQKAVYIEQLEREAFRRIGHRIKINDGGEGKRRLTVEYQDTEDLEELLKKLCGEDFLS